MKRILALTLFLAAASQPGLAASSNSTVIQVLADQVFALVSQEKLGDWNLDDKVCITREKQRVACGIVVQTAPKAAKVKLNFQYKTVKVGDFAEVDEGERSPASVDGSSSVSAGAAERLNFLIGVKQNLVAAIPFVHIQVLSNNHITLGVQIDKFSVKIPDTTNTVTSMGATFNANVYGTGPYTGFWFQGGTGFHILPTTSTGLGQTSYAPTFVGLVGWRNSWALGLNIGIGLGLQYFLLPAGITAEFTFNAFQPILSIDIGFNL